MLNDKERAGSDKRSPFLYVRSAGKATIETSLRTGGRMEARSINPRRNISATGQKSGTMPASTGKYLHARTRAQRAENEDMGIGGRLKNRG